MIVLDLIGAIAEAAWMAIWKIFFHGIIDGAMLFFLIGYIIAIVRKRYPVQAHVIFWLAWLGIIGVQTIFLLYDTGNL